MESQVVAFHEPVEYCRTLMLSRRPSFSASCHWVVFIPRQPSLGPPILRRVRDFSCRPTSPGWEVSEAEWRWPDWERVRGGLAETCPRLECTGDFGVDGTSFSVELQLGFSRIEFDWWQQGPPGWAGLVDWFGATVQEMDGELAEAEQVLLPPTIAL